MTKKQGYSSVVCFVTISIITIIMLLNGLIIHAEGVEESEQETNNSFSGLYGYDFSEYGFWTQQGYENSYFYNENAYLPYGFNDITSSFVDTLDLSNYYQTYPYFVFTQDYSNRNLFYIYLFSEPSTFIIYGNHSYVVSGQGNWKMLECNNSSGSLVVSTVYDYTGSQVQSNNNTHRFIFSNFDVFSVTSNLFGDNILSSTDYVNINYCIYDSGGNLIYNNPITGGGSGSSENASNNMFLQFPKWYFYNIPQLDSLGSYYLKGENGSLGSATFNAELTDYQREHLSEFSIKIDIRTYVYIEETRETVEKHQRFYDYPTQTIPLTTFYSNSNNYNVLVRDIFQNSTFSSPINGNVTYLDTWLDSFDNNYSDELKKLQTKFTATLVSSSSSNTTDSGSCSYVYDYLTGRSFMDDNSLGTNPNPDFDSDQSYNGFDDGSQVVTSGGNTLINNDNDTITIESNGEVAERIVNNMLPEESDAGLSQQFQDILNSNGWVAVVQNTFSFVPESVINTISLYLVTILGILAAAFVLRIVLDLL